MSAVASLHGHSYFSLLRGASSPEALAARAAELGYTALGLTDRDALYGAVRFARACEQHGLQPVIGAELTLANGHLLTLLALDQTGYANLCRLLTLARMGRPKGEALLDPEALAGHREGLACLSGPTVGPLPAQRGEVPALLVEGQTEEALAAAHHYQSLFGDRYFLELQHHYLPHDDALCADLASLTATLGVHVVATVDVHYATPDGRALQDVLTCIRTHTTLDEPHPERLPNDHFSLQPPAALAALFGRYPQALATAAALATEARVRLDFRGARFPRLPQLPEGETPDSWLRHLTYQGAFRRYRPLTARARQQIEHELGVIQQLGVAEFFLICADIAQRFRGRGRGSAADSIVAYCTGITQVDPIRHRLLFERFLNPERGQERPLIDFPERPFSTWRRLRELK